MREFFFSPRVVTREGGGANAVDGLYYVGDAVNRLAAAVEEANRMNRDGQ
jgi:hypothetical protein